jgi:hypothetical protein
MHPLQQIPACPRGWLQSLRGLYSTPQPDLQQESEAARQYPSPTMPPAGSPQRFNKHASPQTKLAETIHFSGPGLKRPGGTPLRAHHGASPRPIDNTGPRDLADRSTPARYLIL